MTQYSDAPGFVLVHYLNGTFPHTQKLQVTPNGIVFPGDEPQFNTSANLPVDMSTAVDDWINLVKTVYDADTTFVSAEFWSKPTEDDDPIWIFEHPINVVGTVAGAVQLAGELVFSFRTYGGNLMKLYFMDFSDQVPLNVRTALGTIGAGANANIRDYVLSGDAWFHGKDNNFAVAPLIYTTKMNDTLRRKEILGL
jgi:hypothetical protein